SPERRTPPEGSFSEGAQESGRQADSVQDRISSAGRPSNVASAGAARDAIADVGRAWRAANRRGAEAGATELERRVLSGLTSEIGLYSRLSDTISTSQLMPYVYPGRDHGRNRARLREALRSLAPKAGLTVENLGSGRAGFRVSCRRAEPNEHDGKD